jgi:hypothetical protein
VAVLVGGVLFGLAYSTWSINHTVDVGDALLSEVWWVRDGLIAAGEAPQAARWLDNALRPATYGGDVLIYLKEAVKALPADSREARQTLRILIGELEGKR